MGSSSETSLLGAVIMEGISDRCEEALQARLKQRKACLMLAQPSELRPLIVHWAEEFDLPVGEVVALVQRLLTSVYMEEMRALDEIAEDPE